jgi:hypothetical protein
MSASASTSRPRRAGRLAEPAPVSEGIPSAAVNDAAARPSPAKLLVPALIGAAVALGLGVYGHLHDPTGKSLFSLVFTRTINMKAWFASAAVALALFQVYSGMRMYGRVPFPRTLPSWWEGAHRASGTLAFLITVPVAYHCLWALGFQHYTTRVLIHSIAGCFFFGAFAAKVVVVEWRSLPGYALPIAGGLVFSALVVIWLSSALWFFQNFGFPQF